MYTIDLKEVDFKAIAQIDYPDTKHLSETEKELASKSYVKLVLWSSSVSYDRGWNTAETYAYVSKDGGINVCNNSSSDTTKNHKSFGPDTFQGKGHDEFVFQDLKRYLVKLSALVQKWKPTKISENYGELVAKSFPRHHASFGQTRGN